MASELPKTGVQAVVEGIDSFIKNINAVNKAVSDSGETSAKAAQKAGALPTSLDKAGKAFDAIKSKAQDFIKTNVPFGDQISSIIDLIGGIPAAALAAIGAIVLLTQAFLDLGNRGAPIQEAGIAFNNLTANVGINSQKLLKDLQAASEGTVSNFDLIKTATTALLGVTGNFGKSLGNTLPQFLKIAKAEADATGRSVNELFNSLVEGVKKAQPRLIESTGLVIDQKKAYQDYAKSLGITVAQLSDTDKSMALLGATLDAGTQAMEALGTATDSNADKLARQQATITNTIDAFAVAVQPAFGVVLDATQNVLNIFEQLGTAVAPIFGGIASIIANVFATILDIITSIAQPIVNIIGSIAPYIALAFQTVANILGGFGKIVGTVIGQVVKFLKDVAKNFFGLDLDNLGPQLFNGAAAAFGSFANGIISVANKLIFPAVIAIAKFIADFLIGFSPPKEGPLSVIDKGGENIMKAWLEGISGVSLDPVTQVAQQVSDALGNVGKESVTQVNARLAQLDKALLPFQNRLAIIQSQFDALNAPAKAALDAIDRQTQELQDAASNGDAGAIDKLKVLDQQRQVIQDQVDAQQALVDGAQIQLGLAQAQQAPERALLTIRKAQLDALNQGQQKQTSAGAEKLPKEKAAKTGAAPIDTSNTGVAGAPVAPEAGLPNVLDLLGGQDKVDAAAKGIQDAFSGQIDQSGLTQLSANSAELGGQLDRIKSVDIGSKITDKFKGLTDAFNPSVAGSIANSVWQFFNGDATNPNSLAGIISTAGSSLSTISGTVITNITSVLGTIFDPTQEGSAMNTLLTFVGQVTGDDKLPGQVADLFSNLPTNIVTALGDLYGTIQGAFASVVTFLTGNAPGTLGGIVQEAAKLFANLGPGIVGALQNFGGIVYNAIVVPIINIMNAAIGIVEGAIRAIGKTFGDFLGGIINGFDSAQVGGTNLGGLVPQALRSFQGNLEGVGSSFTIPRISTALPAFLQPPAGATGGIFSKGFMTVGERGTELMYNAEKMGVVPHEISALLTGLQSILAQPQAVPVMAGNNTTNNTSNNSSFVFNGVQGDNDARRRYNYLKAGMK